MYKMNTTQNIRIGVLQVVNIVSLILAIWLQKMSNKQEEMVLPFHVADPCIAPGFACVLND